jgi:hypothetical protein
MDKVLAVWENCVVTQNDDPCKEEIIIIIIKYKNYTCYCTVPKQRIILKCRSVSVTFCISVTNSWCYIYRCFQSRWVLKYDSHGYKACY